MSITLFPHQERGAAFLAGSPGTKGLFFGMGTGKTITSLEGLLKLDVCAEYVRAVIIAPPIALPMWASTAEDYFSPNLDGKVQLLKTGATKIKTSAQIVVISYAIAASRAAELRDWLGGDGVLICDESHALKSVTAKRTKAILGKNGIADGAEYVWMLTGTPITRWNDDMYPFLCRADLKGMKAELGGVTLDKFQLRYTVRQKRQFPGARWPVQMVVGNKDTDDLAQWVYTDDNGQGRPLALRVDLKEVFESMPPITHNRYEIKLDGDAEFKAAMAALEKSSLADIRKKLESKEPALATLRRQLGLAKVKAAAAEIIERIESGQNVLVGAWHTEVIDALEAVIASKGYTTGIIDGRTPARSKEAQTELWNGGNIKALVCQIAAAGVSLNLQYGGTQIVVVEEDWSPSIMDQFYARLWRYGQEKHVHVDTLTSGSKLDKALGRISATKQREHAKFNAIGQEMNDAAP